MGYAFISYSSCNRDAADAMRALLAKNGICTWMAPYDIPTGRKYAEVITAAVKNCACLVLLLTRATQSSVWVAKEVERAIHYRKPVLPVQLGEVVLNEEFELYISTDQITPVRSINADIPELQKIISVIAACTEKEIPAAVEAPGPHFRLDKVRFFASCGGEGSVFQMLPAENDCIRLQVNFEPTRLRSRIPEYAGAYCLSRPAADIRQKSCIRFRARTVGGIGTLFVELKPEGRAWMHETFAFALSDSWQECRITTEDFEFTKTLGCLEEITFVLKPESFTDMQRLCGVLELSDLIIE